MVPASCGLRFSYPARRLSRESGRPRGPIACPPCNGGPSAARLYCPTNFNLLSAHHNTATSGEQGIRGLPPTDFIIPNIRPSGKELSQEEKLLIHKKNSTKIPLHCIQNHRYALLCNRASKRRREPTPARRPPDDFERDSSDKRGPFPGKPIGWDRIGT